MKKLLMLVVLVIIGVAVAKMMGEQATDDTH